MREEPLPKDREEAFFYALKILKTGSGAVPDSPLRLGPINPVLAPVVETALVTLFWGVKDRDWFEAGRKYHEEGRLCEQLVRAGADHKFAATGEVYSLFFDISELTDEAPLDATLRREAIVGFEKRPVPDTTLISRFPLVSVETTTAVEAARLVAGYLAQAQAKGWRVGHARALVNDWRNEYDLIRSGEKTVMSFDMRPALGTSSRVTLVALTLIAGTPKLEEVIRAFESSQSWPEAFATVGLSLVKTLEDAGGTPRILRRPAE